MIVVRRVAGFATIQDLGRPGFASHGVPRGGALVRTLALRANAAAGNAEAAACVEIFGRLVAAAERDVTIATERGDARALRAGEEIAIDPDPKLRVRYLAIAGGVDAPRRLGSRSTLAVCGFGRPLRAGDRLAPSTDRGTALAPSFDPSGPIGVVLGPDEDEAAVRALVEAAWRIGPASDRTGTRLEGAFIARPGGTLPSSPMVCGAIQLPQGGTPIVIGPDGPTTGGYPVVAVIASADLDRFHALPIGAEVRFEVRPSAP